MQERLWQPALESQDLALFSASQLGSFRVGPKIRNTRLGSIYLAAERLPGPSFEIELFDGVDWKTDSNLEARVMVEMGRDLHVKHTNLPEIRAVGIDEGIPFVVRPLMLGRSLADVLLNFPLSEAEWLSVLELMFGALASCEQDSIARYLSLTLDDVWMGYNGKVVLQLSRARLRGVLEQLRPDHPWELLAHFRFVLPDELDSFIKKLQHEPEFSEAERFVRERLYKEFQLQGDQVRMYLARRIRAAFASEIGEERAAYGLEPLH